MRNFFMCYVNDVATYVVGHSVATFCHRYVAMIMALNYTYRKLLQ